MERERGLVPRLQVDLAELHDTTPGQRVHQMGVQRPADAVAARRRRDRDAVEVGEGAEAEPRLGAEPLVVEAGVVDPRRHDQGEAGEPVGSATTVVDVSPTSRSSSGRVSALTSGTLSLLSASTGVEVVAREVTQEHGRTIRTGARSWRAQAAVR